MRAMNTNLLIITGSAPCLIQDINALQFPDFCSADWMAIGLDAVDRYAWPIRYMATYHPVEIPAIRERRAHAGGNLDYIVISHERKDGVDIVEPLLPGERSGSSALLGTLAALKLGYTRIILCGCPLTGKNDKGGAYEGFQEGWKQKAAFLAGRVRSMSGWTRDFLGAPTMEWLSDGGNNG